MAKTLGRRLQNHPRLLEYAYAGTARFARWCAPLLQRLGTHRLERFVRGPEEVGKRWVFDCRMCGQCILHETGMTCPMTCPKSLRNGPCGGVRSDGGCEVLPDVRCIWLEAFERSRSMTRYGDTLRTVQPPVDRRLEGTSAWLNLIREIDRSAPGRAS